MLGADEQLTTGPVEVVAEGFQFTEGPVWMPGEGWLFSDIPADTIFRADKSVFRKPSGKSNGLVLDGEDRLIACEHWNRRVTRTEKDGSITVLAAACDGKRLNSPNDATVRSDGAVFFTDPQYGLEGREADLEIAGVYMIAPSGEVRLLIDDFKKPNGIHLSLDEKTLYVADTEGSHIRAFDVAEDGSLSKGRVFCELPGPDGMDLDALGRVWCTSGAGVEVFSATGERLGVVECPQAPANCAFGGEDGITLYMTARTGVYKVQCAVAGAK
ncbi:MAG: SMP-30/gluconolactonase/LRE family protein [Candidatus Hydrogenedentes bacterium]|nr:SMP-30/gluconolactonase/LRE family protein [Candidatus Hydrogenedentota bacterium]